MSYYEYNGGAESAVKSFASAGSGWAGPFTWQKVKEISRGQRRSTAHLRQQFSMIEAGFWEDAAFAVLGLSGLATIAMALA